jgi:hypothetical protein
VVDVRSLVFHSLSAATSPEELKRSSFYASVVDGHVPAVDKAGRRVSLPAREAKFAAERGLRILPNVEALPQAVAPAPPQTVAAAPDAAAPAPRATTKPTAKPKAVAKALEQPAAPTQPAPTPTPPTPATRASAGSAGSSLFCGLTSVALILATIVWVIRRARSAPASKPHTTGGAAPPRKAKSRRRGETEIYARRADTCTDCKRRVRENTQVLWHKELREVRHVDCDAAQRTDEADAFVKLVSRLSNAKGPAARRAVIEAAEGAELSPGRRLQLVLEASRLDTEAALEKVEGLKTKEVKRRRLQEALSLVKGDAVPDEMQADQIALLEAALRTLDAEPAE